MIVHIDCNCFFVSCELVSHPDVAGRPAVVANCNETGGGIILALNKEAKAVGLKRGNPLFQVKALLDKAHVEVFPVNHQKYSEISDAIIRTVREQDFVTDIVQYSIDEFFGQMPLDDPEDVAHYLHEVHDRILSQTGIPVCCGAGDTYTLAKTATWFAKHYAGYNEVCVMPADKRVKALQQIDVRDVWGIGRQSMGKLRQTDILTAYDYACKSETYIRKLLGTQGLKTWYELNGTPAIDLGSHHQSQKSISHSRTFVHMLSTQNELSGEISRYISAVAAKLRQQHSLAQTIMVFIATNRHREDLAQYQNEATIRMPQPTDDTFVLNQQAQIALGKIYLSGYQYKQAGVILTDIQPKQGRQLELFDPLDHDKHTRLMNAIDGINKQFGQNRIHLGTADKNPKK